MPKFLVTLQREVTCYRIVTQQKEVEVDAADEAEVEWRAVAEAAGDAADAESWADVDTDWSEDPVVSLPWVEQLAYEEEEP